MVSSSRIGRRGGHLGLGCHRVRIPRILRSREPVCGAPRWWGSCVRGGLADVGFPAELLEDPDRPAPVSIWPSSSPVPGAGGVGCARTHPWKG
jgi:hypothetical protein